MVFLLGPMPNVQCMKKMLILFPKKYYYSKIPEKIVYALLGLQDEVVETGHHYLTECSMFFGRGENKRWTRKNCKVCYHKVSSGQNRAAAKKLKLHVKCVLETAFYATTVKQF